MNNFVMIDSSCWIKFFRNSDQNISDIIKILLRNKRVTTCGIIEMELIQGIRNQKQSKQIIEIFNVLKYFDFERDDFINAGYTIKSLRLSGITVALSDTLIAELCIRNNLQILTLDKDFDYFPKLNKFV